MWSLAPKTKNRGPKLIAAAVKLAAASFNHGSGALIRALNAISTPAGTHTLKAYREIDRGREASEIMKKKEWCKKKMVLRRAERKKKSTAQKKNEGRKYLAGGFEGVEGGAAYKKKKRQPKRAKVSTTLKKNRGQREENQQGIELFY